MTISSSIRKAGPYIGNGVTTLFPFAYKVFKESDVLATFTDPNGADHELALNSDYTVVLNANQDTTPGGVITYPRVGSLIAILSASELLTLTGDLPLTQPTDIPNLSPFFPEVVEDALDRATIQIQQLQEESDRAIKISVSDTPLSPLPAQAARANTVIGFDALGNVAVFPVPSSIGAGDRIPFTLTVGVDFNPGDAQVILPRAPGSPGNLEIFFDPLFQGFDQWTVNALAVTFTSPIPVGVSKIFGYIGTTLSISVPPNDSVGINQLIWNNILHRVVDSRAALRGLDRTKFNRASAVGYYAPWDGGHGDFVLDPLDTTSADNGITVIVGADGGRWKLQYAGSVNVLQAGAKRNDSGFDSTPAFNALIVDARANGYTADFSSGNFYVTQVTSNGGNLRMRSSGAVLIGVPSGVGGYTSVLDIKNAVDLTHDSTLIVSGNHNPGYDCGVKLWADTGVTSLVTLRGISIIGARVAWRFGDPTQSFTVPEKQISEIVIDGGYTFDCPIVYDAYGTQVFATFSNYQMRSSTNGGGAPWLALPNRIGLQVGAHITIDDTCECLITDITTGYGFEINAIADLTFGNQYGTIKNFAALECAAPFAVTGNPRAVATPLGGLIHLDCTGIHTQNTQALVQLDPQFQGNVVIPDTANIYATTPRTQLNVASSSANAQIYVGDKAFGKNCLQGLAGISGGEVHFSSRVIMRLSNLGGQSFPSGTTTAMFQSVDNTGYLARFGGMYNPANGAITFTQKFKGLTVKGGLNVAGMAAGSSTLIKLNAPTTGVYGVQSTPLGTPAASIGTVAVGNILFMDVNNAGSGLSAGSNAFDFFEVTGWN